MRALLIPPVVLLTGVLALAPLQASAAKATITRIERCNRLEQQFKKAITVHAEAKRASEARALQRKAAKFCAGRAQAQGIRAYAKALKMLGVQPNDQ